MKKVQEYWHPEPILSNFFFASKEFFLDLLLGQVVSKFMHFQAQQRKSEKNCLIGLNTGVLFTNIIRAWWYPGHKPRDQCQVNSFEIGMHMWQLGFHIRSWKIKPGFGRFEVCHWIIGGVSPVWYGHHQTSYAGADEADGGPEGSSLHTNHERHREQEKDLA